MTKFTVTRRVPFSADQIYAIAVDVAAYKEFVPLLTASTVRNRKPMPGGGESFDTDLSISYKKLNISETLSSRVEADPVNRIIRAHANEGPVTSLDSEWKLVPAGEGECEIQYSVDYTLKSRSLQFLLSGMFDLMVRRILAAFEQRARKIYGTPATASAPS